LRFEIASSFGNTFQDGPTIVMQNNAPNFALFIGCCGNLILKNHFTYLMFSNLIHSARLVQTLNQIMPADIKAKMSESNDAKINELVKRIQSQLQPHLELRPLEISDYSKKYLSLLEQLTKVGNVSQQQFEQQFEQISKSHSTYQIWVIEDIQTEIIVGNATLIIERKFIHNCGRAGHIEDVVISPTYRGQKLGAALIEFLTELSSIFKCYKVILDCEEKNLKFYEKFGYKQNSRHMAKYQPENE